jgi:hypothetical protein
MPNMTQGVLLVSVMAPAPGFMDRWFTMLEAVMLPNVDIPCASIFGYIPFNPQYSAKFQRLHRVKSVAPVCVPSCAHDSGHNSRKGHFEPFLATIHRVLSQIMVAAAADRGLPQVSWKLQGLLGYGMSVVKLTGN